MDLLVLLLSFDSVLYSFLFFYSIIKSENTYYGLNIIQRYIYYGLCYVTYQIINILFWLNNEYIKYLYLILAIPPIMVYIIELYYIKKVLD